jgi:DNA-binding MarR family transcriptional regulator
MASKTNGELDRSPVHLLHRASQAVEEIFQAAGGDSDLTPRQLAVLATVAGNEGLSQTDIVNLTGIDRSTLADIVKRLSKGACCSGGGRSKMRAPMR